MPQLRGYHRVAQYSRRQQRQRRMWRIQAGLLLIGGFLILFGSMLANASAGVTAGFVALHEGKLAVAITTFKADAERYPERVETRLGLLCALLQGSTETGAKTDIEGSGKGGYEKAEAVWTWLLQRPPEVIERDKSGPPRRYTAEPTRLHEWQRTDPRGSKRFDGYKYWTQAWLSAERVIRAVQRGEEQGEIDALSAQREGAVSDFHTYVASAEKPKDAADPEEARAARAPRSTSAQVSSFAPAGYWTAREAELIARIQATPKVSDLVAGRAALKDTKHDVTKESLKDLQTAMESLSRAKSETPDKLEVRIWWLLVASELYWRDAIDGDQQARKLFEAGLWEEVQGNPDGKSASNPQPGGARNGLKALDRALFEDEPGNAIRLVLGKIAAGFALRQAAPDAESAAQLTAFANEGLAMADASMRTLPDGFPELASLDSLTGSLRARARPVVPDATGGKTEAPRPAGKTGKTQ